MTSTMTLRNVERRAWTLYFQDGLWEIFLGMLFLGGGLRTLTGSLWFYLVVAAGVLTFILGKRFATLPRTGLIDYGPRRKARLNVVRVVALVAILVTAMILVMILTGTPTREYPLGWIFVFGVTGVFLVMASMMNFNRLYGYTILIAASMALAEMFGDPVGAQSQIVAGLVPLAVGVVLLIRFLRDHPVVDQEVLVESGNHDGS